MKKFANLCRRWQRGKAGIPSDDESATLRAVEDGTSDVVFRCAKERFFRGARGDIGNGERYNRHTENIEERDLFLS